MGLRGVSGNNSKWAVRNGLLNTSFELEKTVEKPDIAVS